ncbi:flagellar hook-length control protein FliK [Thermohalobacter berrensis]|uniref:Flagellar hook-length control protein-like C-terminal domain-containing protein n=1 Tax=Thermohalobacter berrensis TaxID=99594 RepID=A0A419TAC3_9FIRM|nr:flagellar hook-length control protein FliK [Thermohalobacter berrensis]RKD34415.1 hypothetical protein BET03_00865 [Thermohalobacter berrensis]
MRIGKLLSDSLQIKNEKSIALSKGTVIRAKVIEINGEYVTLDLGHGNILKGKTNIPLKEELGKTLRFFIKDANDSKIIMTPLNNENVNTMDNEENLKTVLLKNNLEINEENLEILKNLFKYKMPVNRETINRIRVLINKIIGLSNLKEDENIEVMGNSKDILNESLEKLIKVKVKGNINNEMKNQLSLANKSVLKDMFNNITSDYKEKKVIYQLIKRVVFLLKADMKISINSFKFLSEILEGKNPIEKDIDAIINLLKEKISDKELINKASKIIEGVNVKFNNEDKENIKNYYQKLNEIINNIKDILEKNRKISKEVLNKFEQIQSKIDFINRLNENGTFLYIPITLNNKNKKGQQLFILNKKRLKRNSNDFKVFISLNTKNLNKVNILCHLNQSNLNVIFNLENEGIIKLFKEKQENLKNKLSEYGFNVNIKFKVKEKTDPLDLFSEDRPSNYLLDIRV